MALELHLLADIKKVPMVQIHLNFANISGLVRKQWMIKKFAIRVLDLERFRLQPHEQLLTLNEAVLIQDCLVSLVIRIVQFWLIKSPTI